MLVSLVEFSASISWLLFLPYWLVIFGFQLICISEIPFLPVWAFCLCSLSLHQLLPGRGRIWCILRYHSSLSSVNTSSPSLLRVKSRPGDCPSSGQVPTPTAPSRWEQFCCLPLARTGLTWLKILDASPITLMIAGGILSICYSHCYAFRAILELIPPLIEILSCLCIFLYSANHICFSLEFFKISAWWWHFSWF